MSKFLTEELYNEVDDLIERLDALRETLVDARDAKDYEDFNDLMVTAYESAQSMCYDIDDLRFEGSELHSKREEEEEDDNEYQQNFVNALNNFIKAHR